MSGRQTCNSDDYIGRLASLANYDLHMPHTQRLGNVCKCLLQGLIIFLVMSSSDCDYIHDNCVCIYIHACIYFM